MVFSPVGPESAVCQRLRWARQRRGESRELERLHSAIPPLDVPIVFTLTVIAAFVALSRDPPLAWVSYLPLPPLFALLFTGLYLFFLPYVRARK
jgi:hypothetical protein